MALGLGSIAFVGFNADGHDNLAFVIFEPIAAGTVITFTDNAWSGTAFATGESTWTWTAGSDIAAGTVITMDNLAAGLTATSNTGDIAYLTEGTRGLDANTTEMVYAYIGDASAPTFLTAISNGATNNTGSGLLTNTGLSVTSVAGAGNAMAFTNAGDGFDVATYIGPRATGESLDNLRALINNAKYWTTQNTAADDSADGTGPDAPFAQTPLVVDPNAQKVSFSADTLVMSQLEGNSGTTTFTFVVERTNGTTGAVTFTGTVGRGNSTASDYPGSTVPPAFSGTIPEGQTSATVTVTVNGDRAFEPNETFTVKLDSATNNSATAYLSSNAAEIAATGTIVNDDTQQLIGFVAGSTEIMVVEGNDGTRTITFTVERTGDGGTEGNVTFSGTFSRSSTDAADFGGTLPTTAFSGVIPAGQTSATFSITISGDQLAEGNELFTLVLNSVTNPTSNAVLGAAQVRQVDVTILNDDGPSVVHAGETFASIGLTGQASLTIEQGGIVQAISVAGEDFDVTINNAGGFAPNGAGLTTPHGNGKITFNNEATGVISGLTVPKYPAAGSLEFVFNNAGKSGGISAKQNDTYESITINNLAGGAIDTGTTKANGITVQGNTTINNAGKIIALNNDGPREGIEYKGLGVVVHNLAGGWIEGGHHAVTGGQSVLVTNDGTMIGRNGSAVNIDNGGLGYVVTVINHGVMQGKSENSIDSDGDAIDTDGLAVVENWGTIEGLGASGSHNGGLNVSEGIATGGGTITNREGGTIYGYGRAIQIDNSSEGDAWAAVTIVNDGTIKGDGNLPQRYTGQGGTNFEVAEEYAPKMLGGEAINIVGNWDDSLTNTGQIIGGVKLDGGDDVLFNSGTMTATGGTAVDMGAGDDVVTNFLGGVINGAILLGDGDDKFVGNASAENVDGGKGKDLFAGGAGDDILTGGDGADVYSYVLDDGSDTVVEGAGVAGDLDLLMVDGVEADDVTMYKHGSDVEIVFANGDVVTLKDQLGAGGVENVFFTEDGAIYGRDDIVAHLVNREPVAVADLGVAGENETKLFDVLANDSDIDGDTLSLSNFSVTGVSGIALDNGQAQGAFSIQNGQLAFNPGTMFDALNDGDTATLTVSYTVDDGHGGSTTADFVLTVNGNTDPNVITGTVGADPLFGTEGVDIVSANDGNDTVFGRGGNDTIDAGNGTDVVFGGAGNDIIDGGDGKDTLMGDAGNDTLAGGQGNDLLYGGEGNDTFVFHAAEGRDMVFDFQAGAGAGDVIELDHSMFADFEALMAAGAVTDSAIGAQIAYGDGSTITLSGVHKADLAIDDFRFA